MEMSSGQNLKFWEVYLGFLGRWHTSLNCCSRAVSCMEVPTDYTVLVRYSSCFWKTSALLLMHNAVAEPLHKVSDPCESSFGKH